MITPYIRENSEYGYSVARFEVIDYNDLGYLHVIFSSDDKSLCELYIQENNN